MNPEKEYVEKALNSVEPHLHLLPYEVARNIRLAISVMKTYGATLAEFSREIGSEKWAICRNTEANRERYGKCITAKQYKAAERRAIESREPNWKYV